jgi:hypothetical protein
MIPDGAAFDQPGSHRVTMTIVPTRVIEHGRFGTPDAGTRESACYSLFCPLASPKPTRGHRNGYSYSLRDSDRVALHAPP